MSLFLNVKMSKATIAGISERVESLREQLLKYTIYTPVNKSATFCQHVADCQQDELFSVFDACDSAKQKEKEEHLALYCGTASCILKSHLRLKCPNRVVVTSNGEHTCTASCALQPVEVKVYRVGTVQDRRVHVCVKGVCCLAPAAFHQTLLCTIERKLFLCPISNETHLCIPNVCNAAKVDDQSFVCCSLTGNVHSKSNTLLSHGWVEDEWRKAVCKPVYNENFEALPASKSRSKRKAKSQLKRHNAHVQNTCNEEQLLSQLQKYESAKISGSSQQSTYETIKSQLKQMATRHIRCLLPGSHEYSSTRNLLHQRSMLRFMSSIERYIRRCKHLHQQICIHSVTSMHRQINEGNCNMSSSMQLDEERAVMISEGYSSCIVEFILQLLRYTVIKISDFTFRNLVCGILYLLRTNLCIHETDIFSPDAFLSVLPSPANLHFYGYEKSLFTTTKNQIQCCIIESIERGVNAYNLVFPVLPYHDTFL